MLILKLTNRKSHYSSYGRYHCKAVLEWMNLQSGFMKPSNITLIFLIHLEVNAGNINATENSFIQESHMVIWPLKVPQGRRHRKLIGPFSSFCSPNCGNSTVVCHMYMPGSCHHLWQTKLNAEWFVPSLKKKILHMVHSIAHCWCYFGSSVYKTTNPWWLNVKVGTLQFFAI